MTESNGRNGTTDTMERMEAPASGGSGRHRGAVDASAAAPSEQPRPRGRHRGERADEV
ncbi:hypothetical protein ABZ930_34895 [Streptomyces sp. NPDC046716]|uniref:hypothetical protein n=1 Tax=Streptomyces sp. NPDC046716 TaxID=3157093 RepID=UPI0033C40429